MSAEKEHIDPVNTEDTIRDDVDRENLSEKSEISKRLKLISELDALEARGVHVEGIVRSIDPTSNHAFSDETERIHAGDTHFNQEGVTFEPQPEIEKAQPTYAARTRAIIRRNTRALGRRLINRGRP